MNPTNLVRKIRLAFAGMTWWPICRAPIGEWDGPTIDRRMRRLLPSGDFEYRQMTDAEWEDFAPYGDYSGP